MVKKIFLILLLSFGISSSFALVLPQKAEAGPVEDACQAAQGGFFDSSSYSACISDLEDRVEESCDTNDSECVQSVINTYFNVIVTTNNDGDVVEIPREDVSNDDGVIDFDSIGGAAEEINPSDGIDDDTGEPVNLGSPVAGGLSCGAGSGFFDFPVWYEYLQCDSEGGIDQDIEPNSLWLIGVAILEMIIRVATLIAFIMVIWSGFKYIMSQGSPEGTASARKTLVAALVGLGISTVATVSVRFATNLISSGGESATGQLDVPGAAADASIAVTIFNFVYGVAGIVAVIYIVVGAIKFTTSTGEPAKTSSARNTIIYALVGLLVVISAQLVTSAVLDAVISVPSPATLQPFIERII